MTKPSEFDRLAIAEVRLRKFPYWIVMLTSRHHQDFQKFQEAIDGCLADMPTKHRGKLATLLTHNFQTWDSVSLLNG